VFREYWNTFFEDRFRTQKSSKETPYLKVFVIPHSHTDPGWIHTFEDYFHLKTQHIIDNAVDKLEELPHMKFQLSEISFLSKWWEYAHPTRRATLQKLVKEGRLEIATGGWVMTDEATVHLYSMIDQLVEGHQWVKAHLGVVPKTSWSIDPFGHTSAFPYILKTAGIDSMIIQVSAV
jgi:alpha-mannosidase